MIIIPHSFNESDLLDLITGLWYIPFHLVWLDLDKSDRRVVSASGKLEEKYTEGAVNLI